MRTYSGPAIALLSPSPKRGIRKGRWSNGDGLQAGLGFRAVEMRDTQTCTVAARLSEWQTHQRRKQATSNDTGVCETNHSFEEKTPWEDRLLEHQIRGWRAVSAAVLQGEGLHKRSVLFHRHRYHGSIRCMTDSDSSKWAAVWVALLV